MIKYSKKEKKKFSYKNLWDYTFLLVEKKKIQFKFDEIKKKLSFLCDLSLELFWKNFLDQTLTISEFRRICKLIRKHFLLSFPISYLTKKTFFFGLEFSIEEGVFIPQQDSEILLLTSLSVSNVIKKKKKLRVLDLGTGCGVLAISLSKEKPSWEISASDIDLLSLKIAKKNIEKHKRKITLILSCLFEKIDKKKTFDLIISNPPYITRTEYEKLDKSAMSQPVRALIPSLDNVFVLYKKIFSESLSRLEEGGFLIIEINSNLSKELLCLAYEFKIKTSLIKLIPDFSGNYRVILIQKKAKIRNKSFDRYC